MLATVQSICTLLIALRAIERDVVKARPGPDYEQGLPQRSLSSIGCVTTCSELVDVLAGYYIVCTAWLL